jgi:hypothetical protein
MNYRKIYDNIIENSIRDDRKKLKKTNLNYIYYERHHIIPKCLNGDNNEENLVLLTAKEHFVCHKLLTYIYKGNRKIACAFYRMTFDKKGKHDISSRDYAYAKELFKSIPQKYYYDIWVEKYGKEKANEKYDKLIKILKKPKSEEHKNNLKGKNKGKKHTIEQNLDHNRKVSETLKGHSTSKETRQKLSESNRGKIRSEETRKKQSDSHIGKKQSQEHIQNRFKKRRDENDFGIKLKNSQRNEIQILLLKGVSTKKISIEYNVSVRTIQYIKQKVLTK